MTVNSFKYSILFLTTCLVSCGSDESSNTSAANTLDTNNSANVVELTQQVNDLENRLTRLKDINEIKRMQRMYGYYIDRSEWDEVVDMLTDDATAEYGNAGVYEGKESIRALFYGIGYGELGLQDQQLREHTQTQPVITLSESGNNAKGRWRAFVILGQFEEYARWQEGPYENEYRKEDGVWKISKLYWMEDFTVPFKGGPSTAMQQTNVADRVFPAADHPATEIRDPWPATHMLPYHYANPVTGSK